MGKKYASCLALVIIFLTPSGAFADANDSAHVEQIISSDIDPYLKQVLGPNGHLDKTLHDQFWRQFVNEPAGDVNSSMNWVRGNLLVEQEFVKELWNSALLSYKSHRIVKTKRLIQLDKEMPDIVKKSLPWPPNSPQYTEAINGFNSSWATSQEDGNRLLDAAANHKPLIGVNGASRQIDEQTITRALTSVDASFTRLSNLLDKNWNGN
jgi:hypothetical protein